MFYQSSQLFPTVTVAFPARMASLVPPGYQAATDETVVMDPQAIRANLGVLGPKDLLVPEDLRVSMEGMVLREHLETRARAARKESVVQC